MIMKLGFYALFQLLFAVVLHADAIEQNSEINKQWWNGDNHYRLKLHHALTLQDCLNAGIRPRHVPGLAGSRLQFQAKSFTMILPNGKSVLGENGYGEFRISKDYQVTTVAFYEEKFVDFEKCRERLMKSNEAYGGVRTEAEIDAFLDSVRAAERDRTGKVFSVGKTTKEGDEVKYWSSSLAVRNQGTQLLPFRFIMHTEIRTKDKNTPPEYHGLGVLLAPPEGYEHISFAYIPPPTNPNTPHILTPQERSKSLAEKVEEKGAEIFASSEDQQVNSRSRQLAKEEVSATKEKPSRKPWIIAFLLLVGILALLFRRMKDKASS
jgi:hypothetical protein